MRASSQSYLGVDIGSKNIKAVELLNAGGIPELVTYGEAELPSGATPTVEQLGDTLRALVKEIGATTVIAYSALPTHAVFTTILSVPPVKRKEFDAAVRHEAEKLIPRPLDQMVLDPQVLGPTLDGGGQRVLVVGAERALVERYDAIAKRARLNLLGLETEGFALLRSLVGNDKAALVIIDCGAATTDITVIDGGTPFLNRSIRAGGSEVTTAVARILGVAQADAEQLKRDLSAAGGEQARAAARDTVAKIVTEARYTVQQFTEQTGKRVEKIILTGGSALLAGLVEELARALDVRVYVGDPWSRVRFPLELKAVLTASAARYAVAVGLAMRAIKA